MKKYISMSLLEYNGDKFCRCSQEGYNMLKIEHLTKTYGDKKAVDDLTLHIQPGEIWIVDVSVKENLV